MNYFFCCRWRRHHQLAALKKIPSNNNGDSGTPKRQSSHKNNVWIWHMAIYERRTKQSVCVLWLARCVIAMNENTENDLRKCQRQYDVCKFGVCVCVFYYFSYFCALLWSCEMSDGFVFLSYFWIGLSLAERGELNKYKRNFYVDKMIFFIFNCIL